MPPSFDDAQASPSPARVIALPVHPSKTVDDDVPTRQRPLDELEDEICRLAGHIAAATCRWLLLLAEFDRRQGWALHGLFSCAHWLAWKCGMTRRTAQEHVRVARRLEELPRITEAFAHGRLSYSKVRAITRVAEAESEEGFLNVALHSTAGQTERVVAGCARARHAQQESPEEERFLQWDFDEHGCVQVRARLAPEQGALVIKAFEAARDTLAQSWESGATCGGKRSAERFPPQAPVTPSWSWQSSGRTSADALVQLAEAALGGGLTSADRERYQVVVHVDAKSAITRTVGENGICELDNGWAISPETARRLACDSDTVRFLVDSEGATIDVGRKRRTISRRLRRALAARDRHCRFPGCTSPVAEWHHVQHWIEGGRTDRANLVGLCLAHHHSVHEGGFVVSTKGDELFLFFRPDGTLIPAIPEVRAVAGSLEDEQRELGIDAETILPNWTGEKLDLDYAVEVLCLPREQAS